MRPVGLDRSTAAASRTRLTIPPRAAAAAAAAAAGGRSVRRRAARRVGRRRGGWQPGTNHTTPPAQSRDSGGRPSACVCCVGVGGVSPIGGDGVVGGQSMRGINDPPFAEDGRGFAPFPWRSDNGRAIACCDRIDRNGLPGRGFVGIDRRGLSGALLGGSIAMQCPPSSPDRTGW